MIASLLVSLALSAVATPPPALAPPLGLEAQVQAILDDSCTMCHDASDDVVVLEGSPSRLLGTQASTGMALIEPGAPERSYLYLKVTGAEGIEGEAMPLEDDPLTSEQLAVIRDFITALPSASTPTPAAVPPGAQPGSTDTAGPSAPRPPRPKPRPNFSGTHQVALHTTTTLGRNALEFRVHHRFGRVGVKRSYAGLANGAVISFGAAYGILDGWDVLVRSSTHRLDYEIGTKVVPLRQEDGKPFSLGAFASFEAVTEPPERAANRLTGNFHAMLSRLWLSRWATQLTVGYSLLTNHSPEVIMDLGDGPQPVRDRRGTLDVGAASTVWIDKKRRYGVDLEYIFPVPVPGDPSLFYYRGGDADPSGSTSGSWSLGMSARVGLHLFQVFATNTRNIHTNLVAPGGDLGHPFSAWGDFFLGFNLSRKWKF